jgi:hypothetical protein
VFINPVDRARIRRPLDAIVEIEARQCDVLDRRRNARASVEPTVIAQCRCSIRVQGEPKP